MHLVAEVLHDWPYLVQRDGVDYLRTRSSAGGTLAFRGGAGYWSVWPDSGR